MTPPESRQTPAVIDVLAARQRLAPHLTPTPLRPSPWLSDLAGAEVWLKLESMNLTNSFKIRGALNAALRLAESTAARATRVVTASAGNHGQALALACTRAGISCIVFAPATAPDTKKQAIVRYGGDLHLTDDYDAAEHAAKAFAAAEGIPYVSPYGHPDVIAGAGTIGLELVGALPTLATVAAPVGGGGLVSGIGLAVKAAAPAARLIGVEVEASTPFASSLRAGHIVSIEVRPSLADGLIGNLDPDTITFDIASRVVDEWMAVTEGDLRRALDALQRHEHLVVEGAAAVGVAAVMAGVRVASPAVVVVTGANADWG
jgi:threonine dehydratase